MAKRKRTKTGKFKKGGGGGKTKTIIKYRTRSKSNPSKRKSAASYARGTFAGVNIRAAFGNSFPLLLGMLCAKFAAKKFAPSDSPGGEFDQWTWKNYALAAAGGLGGALLVQSFLKGRYIKSQKVMEGAMALIMFKIFAQEIAPQNEYLDSWFGADEDDFIDPGYEESDEYSVGDIYEDTAGSEYVMGDDGAWRPIDESHRMVDPGMLGGVVPVDPTMGYGGEVQPVDPTMGGVIEDYRSAYPMHA